MEHGISNSSLPVLEQKSGLFRDPNSSSLFSGSSISFAGSSVPSDMQEESVDNIQMANDTARMPDSADLPFTSVNNHIDNYGLQDNINGESLCSIPLLRLLSASLSSPEDPTSVSYSAAMTSPFNVFRHSGISNTLESTDIAPGSSRYGTQEVTLLDKKSYADEKGDVRLNNDTDQYEHVFLGGKMDHVCPSHAMEMSEPVFLPANNMVDPSWNHIQSKKLSFNLGYPELSVVNVINAPRHCSEFDLTDISGITPKNNTSSDDFGLLRSPLFSIHFEQPTHSMLQKQIHFSPALSGSRYLRPAQQILLEVARCAFKDSIEHNHQVINCTGNESSLSFSSGSSGIIGSASYRKHEEEALPFNSTSTHKLELMSLLRMMDSKYNNCINQIQCVVGAFSEATESKTPHMHVQSPLHTVSILYKNLRERITTAILSSSQHINEHSSEKAQSFESSFMQKQWDLQQIKRNVSWRPQRGLPERSVSVLRAWMFENFLHPYPKDSEKHLLAIKSGLTRSQVSNWFINARVRLWKPMIEEMYWEFNKKRRTEDEMEDHRGPGNVSSQRMRREYS